MASTMKDLFDDDSSDEDEETEQNEETPPPDDASSPNVRRVIQEIEDDDSSSDEPSKPAPPKETVEGKSDEETEETSVEHKSNEETPAEADTPKRTTEEDEDEDDVEFDDDDGVVGTSAPTNKEVTEDAQATPTAKRPPKKHNHIQVLESDRPPAGTSLHITKLPNLVGIQTEPFDPDTHSASLEEQDYRGYVHSMIRWRYARTDTGELKRDADGKLIRESNARLVTWDDGNGGPKSYTLHVGNEVFEVDTIDSSSTGFAGLNGYLYLSQKASLPDENHTPAGTVLESMGAIQNRLAVRPSSLQSEAHKNLTVAVRQKTIKRARIAEYVTQEDPEKAKQERIKVKQDLEKASARKRQTSYRRPAMSRRYLEEDDGDYDTINIRDMKRGRDLDEDMDYGEDSEEEEEEDNSMFNRRRPTKAARASRKQEVMDDDEEDELVFEEESDEDEIKATSRKKLQHQALVDDDDDD